MKLNSGKTRRPIVIALGLLPVIGIAAIAMPTEAEAQQVTRCYHTKPYPSKPNSLANTGTHGPADDARYKRSGYYTNCRSLPSRYAFTWASECAAFYSKYFPSRRTLQQYSCK